MSELIVIGREKSPEQIAAETERPAYVVAGTGGKFIEWPDGRKCGPIDGPALQGALARGAKVVGEQKVQTVRGKSVVTQQAEAQAQHTMQQRDFALVSGRK